MYRPWKMLQKWRKITYQILLTVAILYAVLLTFHLGIHYNLKNMPINESHKLAPEYTLPSLRVALSAVQDNDIQRALRNFYEQFQQTQNVTPPQRIIISSTWRSGSTLLGEILSSYPGSFYHYEPLMQYGFDSIDNAHATQLIMDLLQCNYENQTAYLKFSYLNSDLFRRNVRLWKMCLAMPRHKCFIASNLYHLCSIFPIHIMKLVRARLATLESLMDEPNTRIIWLVRDPRATISSRTFSVSWCKTKSCSSLNTLCRNLDEDYTTFLRFKQSHPDSIQLVRYEDLVRSPAQKVEEVLQFCGLTMHTDVLEYLTSHFQEEYDVPWSTIHKPETALKRWKQTSPWSLISRVQYHCRPQMHSLGYVPFSSEKEFRTGKPLRALANG